MDAIAAKFQPLKKAFQITLTASSQKRTALMRLSQKENYGPASRLAPAAAIQL